MKLAIDNGNSDIVFCLFDRLDNIIHLWRCANDPNRSKDEYAQWFIGLLYINDLKPNDITSVGIVSVVPKTKQQLIAFAHDYLCAPYIVDSRNNDFGFHIDIDQPNQVGGDRLVNGVSGMAYYGKPLIVVDFGTATSFDIFNQYGNFIGGLIAPGVYLSMKALSGGAAQLPDIDIAAPQSLIGKNTVHAMQSGIYWGYIVMVRGILTQLTQQQELSDCQIVMTGGLAQFFYDQLSQLQPKIDLELTLKGLLIMMNKEC